MSARRLRRWLLSGTLALAIVLGFVAYCSLRSSWISRTGGFSAGDGARGSGVLAAMNVKREA